MRQITLITGKRKTRFSRAVVRRAVAKVFGQQLIKTSGKIKTVKKTTIKSASELKPRKKIA